MSFYEGLFGWRYRQMEASPEADYVMIEHEGTLIGGLRRVTGPSTKTSHVLKSTGPVLYFSVDHLPAKVTRAKELGAEIVGETVKLGLRRGCYQWIRDRAGNLIGLWAAQ